MVEGHWRMLEGKSWWFDPWDSFLQTWYVYPYIKPPGCVKKNIDIQSMFRRSTPYRRTESEKEKAVTEILEGRGCVFVPLMPVLSIKPDTGIEMMFWMMRLSVHRTSQWFSRLGSQAAFWKRRLKASYVGFSQYDQLYSTIYMVYREIISFSLYSTLYGILGEYQFQSLCVSVCLCFQWILFNNRFPMLVDRSSSNLVEW